MAIYTYTTTNDSDSKSSRNYNGVNHKRKLYVSITSASMGLLLLVAMGIVLITTAIMLLFFSPLLLLLSPLLLLAGFVLAGSLAGFGTAGAMALGGIWSLRMGFGKRRGDAEGYLKVSEILTESKQTVTEENKDFGGYYERKVTVRPPDKITEQLEVN